jgi:hypothetical protein
MGGDVTTASVPDATKSAQEDHGPGSGLYVALVPWVVFTVLAQRSTLKVAAVVALVAAIAIMVRSIMTSGMKLLELGAVVATNRRLTIMWAWVFTAFIPFHVLAGVIDERPTNFIFNWAIPIALIVWAAKRTSAISAEAKPAP